MCRIAGVFNIADPIDQTIIAVQSMCSRLSHGGPDDEGLYIDKQAKLVLGHRRLSIIDISPGGHQPMQFDNGRFIITYNGELYNYRELKYKLQSHGVLFNTESDTEVILAAYATWGTDAFQYFEGMYAFVLYDKANAEILMVRDINGIKPLYYAITPEGLSFASEVKALASLHYLNETDNRWPVFLMAYGFLPEPATTLKKVKPLQKGHWLKYNLATHQYQLEGYYKQRFIERISNRKKAIELVAVQLEEAVKSHLVADAPLGVFLSGGLDSGIIAMLAARHKKIVDTVSIYFDDSFYSEKKFQDELLTKLQTRHHAYKLTAAGFHEHLPAVIHAMDMPCYDGVNTWFISNYAKQSGLKAVLSGIGGDELFGGYPSFKRMGAAALLQQMPDKLLKSFQQSGNRLLKRLSYLAIAGGKGRYLFLRGQFVPADIARQLNENEAAIWTILEQTPSLPEIDYLHKGNQVSWLETNLYLQNQLLRDADVMGMANGIEIRVPFLYKNFMELATHIKADVKFKGRLGKQLLIDAFGSYLPQSVWNRSKMGFSFPFKDWLSHPQYAGYGGTGNLQANHTKLKAGELHWSQFFTLMLIDKFSSNER
jgi:asparagine synthase (glutamine-hydrolysing)